MALPRPGFQNRRDQAPLLRALYPSGFGVARARSELLLDPAAAGLPPRHHGSHPAGGGRAVQLAPLSFTRWTRGGAEDSSTIASYSITEDERDPFADCAGPTLQELNSMKRATSQQQMRDAPLNDPSLSTRRCKINMDKQAAYRRLKAASTKPQTSVPVYHAPASLPILPSNLSGARVSVAYEQWLADKRRLKDEQRWYVKGNNESANYSSHTFLPDGSQSLRDLGSSSLTAASSAAMHVAFADLFPAEIHTSNQVLRARSTTDLGAHYSYKMLNGATSLREVKAEIVQDIVRSIQHAFAADLAADCASVHSAASAASSSGAPLDLLPHEASQDSAAGFDSVAMNSLASTTSKISVVMGHLDLVLSFYHPGLQAWRALGGEEDWVQAKHVYSMHAQMPMGSVSEGLLGYPSVARTPALQIMYALEPRSEQQLLREIEAHYELRRQQTLQAKEHISIAALTEALHAGGSANKSWVSDGASVALAQPSSPQQRSAKGSSLLSSGPSILYPKPSAQLQTLAQQGASSQAKLHAVAKRLEQKILKTKW